MHSYLRSIGFSDVSDINDLNDLIQSVIDDHNVHSSHRTPDGRVIHLFKQNCGFFMRLVLCGEYDNSGLFYPQYLCPEYIGEDGCVSALEELTVEKNVGNDSYLCGMDDVRIGATIIFHLNNFGDYLNALKKNEFSRTRPYTVRLSALSDGGTILLPVKNSTSKEKHIEEENERRALLQAAQNGDAAAMESLTLEEFDTYSMLIERIEVEDVYSIVDTFFMPRGITSDRYSIMGTIDRYTERKNARTNEEVAHLRVNCNGIHVHVCINKKDLVGQPAIGRRFKGDVWLQGQVVFSAKYW